MKIMHRICSILLFAVIALPVFAEPQPAKIAVVDIQKVVQSSAQVKALKTAGEAKNKELTEFLKKAQTDINKQTDDNKKKSLKAKYEKQIMEKREANAKEYATKLKAIDASITSLIGQKASELGYTIVLPKSGVIFGGDDITDTILKVVK